MIQVISPYDQSTHPINGLIEVQAKITDDSSYIQAELMWGFNGVNYPCPYQSEHINCVQNGNDYQWRVRVTEGEREFKVRAFDLAGNEAVSPSRTVYLVDPQDANPQNPDLLTPPNNDQNSPPPSAPEVSILAPTQYNSNAMEESSIDIIADVQSSAPLAEVVLVWDYNQNRYPCPTQQTYVDCSINGSQYIWTVRLTAPALRSFHIEALDQNGQKGVSDTYYIDVDAEQMSSVDDPTHDPTNDPMDNSMTPPMTSTDQTPPEIYVVAPTSGDQWSENSEVEVIAEIYDESGVESVLLRWDFNDNDYPCPHQSQYVDCDVDENRYLWRVRVNEGERRFRIWARDYEGNSTHSSYMTMELVP